MRLSELVERGHVHLRRKNAKPERAKSFRRANRRMLFARGAVGREARARQRIAKPVIVRALPGTPAHPGDLGREAALARQEDAKPKRFASRNIAAKGS